MHVVEDPAVGFEESAVGEEVALDPREGYREVDLIELGGPRVATVATVKGNIKKVLEPWL